jgi:hypothetical protein
MFKISEKYILKEICDIVFLENDLSIKGELQRDRTTAVRFQTSFLTWLAPMARAADLPSRVMASRHCHLLPDQIPLGLVDGP